MLHSSRFITDAGKIQHFCSWKICKLPVKLQGIKRPVFSRVSVRPQLLFSRPLFFPHPTLHDLHPSSLPPPPRKSLDMKRYSFMQEYMHYYRSYGISLVNKNSNTRNDPERTILKNKVRMRPQQLKTAVCQKLLQIQNGGRELGYFVRFCSVCFKQLDSLTTSCRTWIWRERYGRKSRMDGECYKPSAKR